MIAFLALTNADQIYADIIRLDDLIDRFIASLRLPQDAVDPDQARILLVTHTLAHAATIQLHSKFRQPDSPVESKDLAAARTAVNLINNVNLAEMPFLDPILAVSVVPLLHETLSHRNTERRHCADPLDGSEQSAAW